MSLFFILMILREMFLVSNCTCITSLSERGNSRNLQASRFPDDSKPRLWSWPMSKPIHNEKKSLSRTKKHLATKPETQRATAACQGTIGASRDIECPGCLTVFWLTSNRKYRAGCFSIVAIYLRRVSPPSLFVEIGCAVEIDTTMSPLLWRAKQALLRNYEALSYCDTSSLRPISKVEGSFRHI